MPAMWRTRPGRCGLTQWMFPAVWKRARESRMRPGSPRSSTRLTRLTYNYPDSSGHFGPYGGIYVAETLMGALDELRAAYQHYSADPEFQAEFAYELKHY